MSVAISLDTVAAFGLALTRMLGIFLFAPVFGHTAVAFRVRLGLAVAIAWLVAPQLGPSAETLQAGIGLAVVREAVIGVALGLGAQLVFAGFSLMAELASIQGGLGAASVLDPSSGANSVVLTSLVGAFALFIFLAAEAHHDLLRAAWMSFERLPPGGTESLVPGFAGMARLGHGIFDLAVRLAAPFTAVMLVTNLAVGMLGRAIPQLNLMSLQLPAQVGITLLLLALGAAPFADTIARELEASAPLALEALLGGR